MAYDKNGQVVKTPDTDIELTSMGCSLAEAVRQKKFGNDVKNTLVGGETTSPPSVAAVNIGLSKKADKVDVDNKLSSKADKSSVDVSLSQKADKSDLASKADKSDLASKQDKLASGTNIKTINGKSILGSGNIVIQGGGGGSVDIDTTIPASPSDSRVPSTMMLIENFARKGSGGGVVPDADEIPYKDTNVGAKLSELERLDVPSYYHDYLNDKVKDIYKLILSSYGHSSNYIFITDTHWSSNHKMSAKLISKIKKSTLVDRLIWGGDANPAFGTENDMYENMAYQQMFAEDINCNYYPVRGNHDCNITDAGSKLELSSLDVKRINIGKSAKNIHTNDSGNGTYYYFDDANAKLRFIVYDLYEQSDGRPSDEQIKWLYDNAFCTIEDGWDFVCIMHAACHDTTSIDSYKSYWKLSGWIKSYNNKASSYTQYGNYNFSNNKGKVILIETGHEHQDLQTTDYNGCWIISTCCDANYEDYRRSQWYNYANTPSKAKGTINEQSFDIVNIDMLNQVLTRTRIGGGYNRYYDMQLHELSIGGNIELVADKIEVAEWHSYNAEGATYIKGQGWSFVNDIIEVKNGIVTAKKSGNACVVAKDIEGNMQFFAIKVI